MGAAPPAAATGRRKKVLGAIAGGVLVASAAYFAWWALAGRYRQSTDDAYVGGNVVQITPQVAGTVVAIHADDTQFVAAGQALVELDRADTTVALERAEADLAKTVREVRRQFATARQLRATVDARRTDVTKAQEDYARRQRLASSGAISAEEAQHARDTLDAAQANLAAAQETLAASMARIDGTTVEHHPDVEAAAARVREAYLAYLRTTLLAPVSGFVAKRSVQLGEHVDPGMPLMAIVPLDEVWVDANYKEDQLDDIRIGQPVRLRADANGADYHGTVAGLAPGTGAAFALLPAQNATGNWIKVVQRLPVRIALARPELEAHPLQIGLSMQVDVDVHDRSGSPLGAAHDPGYHTSVFASQQRAPDAPIAQIIARNMGAAPPDGRPRVVGAASRSASR
ncbi:MAG TPA: HlyD family efflux transporter periplasmic adaptor subunit [Casimicrobiaceae bacterium]|jgi:membrane fusion protein (multidrug efflux system)